jgi:hypothetical protein
MRILVAIEAVDGRKGIDSLARLCQEKLQSDPFSGCLFVFRSRRGTSIRILVYDGQGFWLAQKRFIARTIHVVAERERNRPGGWTHTRHSCCWRPATRRPRRRRYGAKSAETKGWRSAFFLWHAAVMAGMPGTPLKVAAPV